MQIAFITTLSLAVLFAGFGQVIINDKAMENPMDPKNEGG
jgi:hypothetical protein